MHLVVGARLWRTGDVFSDPRPVLCCRVVGMASMPAPRQRRSHSRLVPPPGCLGPPSHRVLDCHLPSVAQALRPCLCPSIRGRCRGSWLHCSTLCACTCLVCLAPGAIPLRLPNHSAPATALATAVIVAGSTCPVRCHTKRLVAVPAPVMVWLLVWLRRGGTWPFLATGSTGLRPRCFCLWAILRSGCCRMGGCVLCWCQRVFTCLCAVVCVLVLVPLCWYRRCFTALQVLAQRTDPVGPWLWPMLGMSSWYTSTSAASDVTSMPPPLLALSHAVEATLLVVEPHVMAAFRMCGQSPSHVCHLV